MSDEICNFFFQLSCFGKQNKKEIIRIRATDLEFCSVFFPNVKNGSLRSESGAKFENDSIAGAAARCIRSGSSSTIASTSDNPILHSP